IVRGFDAEPYQFKEARIDDFSLVSTTAIVVKLNVIAGVRFSFLSQTEVVVSAAVIAVRGGGPAFNLMCPVVGNSEIFLRRRLIVFARSNFSRANERGDFGGDRRRRISRFLFPTFLLRNWT